MLARVFRSAGPAPALKGEIMFQGLVLRRSLRGLAFLARAAVLAGVIASPLVISDPASAQTPVISIPKDESPHRDAWMEWWYFTGHLTGTDHAGKVHNYGFELTLTHNNALGLEPLLSSYSGQLAVTDLARGSYKMFEDNYAIQTDYVPPHGGFNITVNGWHMQGINGQNSMLAGFLDGSYILQLDLNQSTPPTLHGSGGLIPYGPFGQSYYYSETNLQTSGTILDHGELINVTGLAWQDHQWGDFATGNAGWTWFALQLSNGTQYMIYFIHDSTGKLVQTVGTLVNADGTTQALDPSQLSQTPQGSWTSPTSGVTYDQNWIVKVPGGELTVTTQLADQELTSSVTPITIWEGTCTVTGQVNGRAVTGKSYAEVIPVIQMPQPPGT
jgi:predicted secreted hydrolase